MELAKKSMRVNTRFACFFLFAGNLNLNTCLLNGAIDVPGTRRDDALPLFLLLPLLHPGQSEEGEEEVEEEQEEEVWSNSRSSSPPPGSRSSSGGLEFVRNLDVVLLFMVVKKYFSIELPYPEVNGAPGPPVSAHHHEYLRRRPLLLSSPPSGDGDPRPVPGAHHRHPGSPPLLPPPLVQQLALPAVALLLALQQVQALLLLLLLLLLQAVAELDAVVAGGGEAGADDAVAGGAGGHGGAVPAEGTVVGVAAVPAPSSRAPGERGVDRALRRRRGGGVEPGVVRPARAAHGADGGAHADGADVAHGGGGGVGRAGADGGLHLGQVEPGARDARGLEAKRRSLLAREAKGHLEKKDHFNNTAYHA